MAREEDDTTGVLELESDKVVEEEEEEEEPTELLRLLYCFCLMKIQRKRDSEIKQLN